jgi:hypothetical protein
MKPSIASFLMLSLCCVSADIGAQTSAEPARGKIFYTGKVGFFSKTSEYTVEAKSPTLSVYTGNDVLLFDSKTFALVHMKSAPENFDAAIEGSGNAGTLEVGSTWNGKYKQPATRQSQCATPSDQDFTATVTGKEAQAIDIAGAKAEVEIVSVQMTGTWSSCGYRGTWKATRKYAPSLGLLVLTDSETLMDGRMIAGGSLRLDHIER